ncbi:hypothetical protein M0L17_25215 [Bacillaceae bacterium OS4b]|nr:hypothetical protein [Bacillaceae bacterium OS4b]
MSIRNRLKEIRHDHRCPKRNISFTPANKRQANLRLAKRCSSGRFGMMVNEIIYREES